MARADEQAVRDGHGPCPEAMRTGTVVRVEHMAAGVVTAFEEGLADRPERW